MRLNKQLTEKIQESMASVLPITAIVFLLSISIAPLDPGTLVLFLFGAILLVGGMGLFTLGVDMSMIPMGEGVGSTISKHTRLIVPIAVYFLLGVLTTMAEPDLQVLSKQVSSINSAVLIITVAVGVGLFLVAATLRVRWGIPLRRLLLVLYFAVFALAFLAPGNFIPVSFDSGGVTTGPVTVPFIMSLGLGIASTRSDKNSASDSFGLISLCSIGPILCVLLLGIIYKPQEAASHLSVIPSIPTTAQAAQYFIQSFPTYLREVAMALLPVAGLFLVFQLLTRRFKRGQLIRIVTGLLYTYLGLVLFLCGVNVGFMPAGQLIGATIANGVKWLLVPIGMLIGYYIVKAEPAVSGLTFLVPSIFTGIAFDSGGVASGPMTATFLLPFAQGACHALGGNMMTDAFGIVAMVAMTPLVTIQVMGLSSIIHHKLARRRLRSRMELVEDMVLYFD